MCPKRIVAIALAAIASTLNCMPPAPVPANTDTYAVANTNSYAVTSVETTEPGGARLRRECDAKKPLACSVLASAFENGDSINAPEIGRDIAAAATYRIKACQLGSGADCNAAGDAFADGKGVQQDKSEAIKYLRMACDNYNTMTPFACSRMAQLLLELDFFGNYDEAMARFARGCAERQIVCKLKEAYSGTGRVSSATVPRGAVDYAFGMAAKETEAVCAQQGGTFSSNPRGGSPDCRTPHLEVLNLRPRYINFDFCKHNSLCSLTIAINETPSAFLGAYGNLRAKLSEIYGAPSMVTVKTTPDCRTVDAAPDCVESGKARFSSGWSWNDEGGILLGVVAARGHIALTLTYYNSDGARALGAAGL